MTCTETYNFDTPVTEDLTLYAQWTANTYAITYDLDGGTASGNPETYTVESETFTLNPPHPHQLHLCRLDGNRPVCGQYHGHH